MSLWARQIEEHARVQATSSAHLAPAARNVLNDIRPFIDRQANSQENILTHG